MAAEISRWLCCEFTQESVAEIHGVASSPLPFGKPLYAHGSVRWIYRARVHKNVADSLADLRAWVRRNGSADGSFSKECSICGK